MADLRADAQYAALVLYASDMVQRTGAQTLEPEPDERLSPDWIVRGHLSALDAIFRRGPLAMGERTFYGMLVESVAQPGSFAVAIRGTEGWIEWAEDGLFRLINHIGGGRVELGFFSLFSTMQLDGQPCARRIAEIVGDGTLTVVGHSLGSALAEYLTMDLVRYLGNRVKGRFFASPHPGDGIFAATFHARISDYATYAIATDIVPHLPIGLGYTALGNLITITPNHSQARICFSLKCFHHITTYIASLDYGLLDWKNLPTFDQELASCIKGPTQLGPFFSH